MKKYITLLCLVLLIFISFQCSNSAELKKADQIYIASWNLENLFDTTDHPEKKDEWYTPSSEINWTDEKLNQKLENLSTVIEDMNNNKGPDILGLQEVENIEVLRLLIDKIDLERNYDIVHYESPDVRGIDNALIYDSDLFELVHSEALKVELPDDITTRDILFASFNFQNQSLNIFVNHWPSRREGLKETEIRRIKAAETLNRKIVSLGKNKIENVVVLGDFNDLPSNISIRETLGAGNFDCEDASPLDSHRFLNLSTTRFQRGEGTYKYRDHWNMLDQIIISNNLFDGEGLEYICGSFEILKPDYLIQKEGKYRGTSLPTYGGRKYLGGYSDHFAISAKFHLLQP